MLLCYTCGSEIRGQQKYTISACSKECRTPEFKLARNEWLIEQRGYPLGYKTPEEYVKFGKLTEMQCSICATTFMSRGGKETCSPACAETRRTQKARQTKISRYGHAGPNQEKLRATCIEKYGVEYPSQSETVKEKYRNTCIEKYGVDNASKSGEVVEKIAQKHMEKYGVRNIFERRDIIESAFERKYGEGIKNPQQVPEISKRTHETMKEKYELLGAVPKDKTQKTCLERYGHEFFFGSDRGRMTRENLKTNHAYTDEEVTKMFKNRALTLEKIRQRCDSDEEAAQIYSDICASYDSSSFKWALKKCSGDEKSAIDIHERRSLGKQTQCGAGSMSSLKLFSRVERWLEEEYSGRFRINVGDATRKEWFIYDRANKRISFYDFTIFDNENQNKLIIEFNGRYWHPMTEDENPEGYRNDQYKKRLAEENGFKYIVVWDSTEESENLSLIQEEIRKWVKS